MVNLSGTRSSANLDLRTDENRAGWCRTLGGGESADGNDTRIPGVPGGPARE